MKAKPFKGAQVPDITGKGPFYEITRAELVALIAKRLKRKTDDDAVTMRNRVSSRIDYYTRKTGRLRPTVTGTFQLGAIAAFAREVWPGEFDDLPGLPIRGCVSGVLTGLRGTATGFTAPSTLQAAIGEIVVLREEVRVLVQALADKERRVRELEPDAQKRRDWIENKKGKRWG